MLAQEFLSALGIAQYRLAKAIGVAPTRIGEIVHDTRGISTDTALRRSCALGTSERFLMILQSRYDLEREREAHAAELGQIEPLVPA